MINTAPVENAWQISEMELYSDYACTKKLFDNFNIVKSLEEKNCELLSSGMQGYYGHPAIHLENGDFRFEFLQYLESHKASVVFTWCNACSTGMQF